jgi:MFS family permease
MQPQRDDDSTGTRSGVLALLCLMAAIAYIQRAAVSVPASEIATDLKLANLALDMGWVQSAWYWGYALCQIPAGWWADRVGSRTALAWSMLAWSAATLLAGFAVDLRSLVILWAIMGMAQAAAFPCAAKAIGQLFPDSQRARASGILAAGMAIGGALAPALAGWLLERFQPWETWSGIDRWRLLLAVYALPGVVWTGLFLVLVRPSALPYQLRQVAATPIDWSRMFTSAPLALLCAQQFFRAAGMVFFLTWFPTFLQKTRGVSMLESGQLTTVAGIGAVLGSLSGGFVSDWMLARTRNARLSRQGIAVVGMATCAGLIVWSALVTDVRTSIALIALGAFSATFGGVSGYTVAIQFGGRQTATVFSAMNMCGNFGAALFPLAAGYLVAQTGNWNLILYLFAAIMAIDAICWALLNPKGTLFNDSP